MAITESSLSGEYAFSVLVYSLYCVCGIFKVDVTRMPMICKMVIFGRYKDITRSFVSRMSSYFQFYRY